VDVKTGTFDCFALAHFSKCANRDGAEHSATIGAAPRPAADDARRHIRNIRNINPGKAPTAQGRLQGREGRKSR
jgi:hypothetical protein